MYHSISGLGFPVNVTIGLQPTYHFATVHKCGQPTTPRHILSQYAPFPIVSEVHTLKLTKRTKQKR